MDLCVYKHQKSMYTFIKLYTAKNTYNLWSLLLLYIDSNTLLELFLSTKVIYELLNTVHYKKLIAIYNKDTKYTFDIGRIRSINIKSFEEMFPLSTIELNFEGQLILITNNTLKIILNNEYDYYIAELYNIIKKLNLPKNINFELILKREICYNCDLSVEQNDLILQQYYDILIGNGEKITTDFFVNNSKIYQFENTLQHVNLILQYYIQLIKIPHRYHKDGRGGYFSLTSPMPSVKLYWITVGSVKIPIIIFGKIEECIYLSDNI